MNVDSMISRKLPIGIQSFEYLRKEDISMWIKQNWFTDS